MVLSVKDTATINDLLKQLSKSATPISHEKIKTFCSSPNTSVLVVRDTSKEGRIIAMATFIIYETLFRRVGRIEDVVVDEEYRGKKIGLFMIGRLIKLARASNISFVELTSNSARIAANNLYKKLGFKERDTNCYRLEM